MKAKHTHNMTKGAQPRRRENMVDALKYRQAGKTYREIGKLLGVDHSTAYRYVMDSIAELKELSLEEAETVRTLALTRLDRALDAIQGKIDTGDLGAINTMLRIEERRSKFEGLDTPTKAEITVATPEPITFVLNDHDKGE